MLTPSSKPWYNFAGLTPEDKQSINWMESVQPEDTHLLEEAWQKITVQHIPATFQFRAKKTFVESFSPTEAASVRHKIGQCFAYPDFDDEGALVSIMGIVIDISELKSVEDQLRMQTTVLTERMEEAILLRERQESFIDVSNFDLRYLDFQLKRTDHLARNPQSTFSSFTLCGRYCGVYTASITRADSLSYASRQQFPSRVKLDFEKCCRCCPNNTLLR